MFRKEFNSAHGAGDGVGRGGSGGDGAGRGGSGGRRRFTDLDIERYHRGQMTGAERHALERAALDDPFLEEALEGYALLPPGQAAGDLALLRERLAGRVAHRRKRAAWWAAAAAVVVLGGVGVAVYRMGGRKEMEMARAVTKDTVRVGATASGAVASGAAAPDAVASGAVAKAAAHKARRRVVGAMTPAKVVAAAPVEGDTAALALVPPESAASTAAAPAGAPETAAAPAAARNALAETLLKKLPGVRVDSAGDIATRDEAESNMRVNRKQFFANNATTMFKNRVIDYNHRPIEGATLQIGPARNYVVTDQKGYFRFNGIDSQRVVVTAVGYKPRTYYAYELNNVPAIQLSQDTNLLNDVVVVGYGTAKSKSAKRTMGGYHAVTDTNAAQPLEGWSSYNDYITNNLQLPGQVVENHIHGEVDLTFEVDEAGKPVNISVVKSLCDPCDAEAVRLLQQGPGWSKDKKARGKKARGKLKVKF